MADTFLIAQDNAAPVEVEIIDRFSTLVGGLLVEFVVHETSDPSMKAISQYRSGYKALTVPAAASRSSCIAAIEQIVARYGVRRSRQIFEEQQTINPKGNTMEVKAYIQNYDEQGRMAASYEVTCASTKDAIEAVNELRGGGGLKAVSASDAPKPAKKDKAPPTAKEAVEDALARAKADESAAPILDLDKDVKPLLVQLSAKFGRDAAIKLMKEVGGVEKSGDLKAEHYEAIVSGAKAQLAAEEL